MGVPLTYMDFAPEPPAPTATPVITTEMNCNPSHDTKDLSRKFAFWRFSLSLWFMLIINIINKTIQKKNQIKLSHALIVKNS